MNQCRADYCLSLKHKNTQPSSIFNREMPQNSESQNGLRRGLDFIALNLLRVRCTDESSTYSGNLFQQEESQGFPVGRRY